MDKNASKKALIRNFQPDAEMFVSRSAIKTHQDFLQDLSRVISALKQEPSNTFLVNACEDRYFFTLVFSAGIVCNLTNLLPQNRQPETLRLLTEKYGRLITIADYKIESQHADYYVSDFLSAHSAFPLELPFIVGTHVAAIAFTSGSTGDPQPNKKFWKTLSGTAEKLAQRLLTGIDRPTIVATVPSQHMYGMEMTVMMALQGGCAVHRDKPFFPSDIVETISSSSQQTVLVTTPVHLRVLATSGLALPELAKIVSATAPLAPAIAQEAEEKMHTTLEEIYGCTEAGSLATRHSTQDNHWHLLDGMTVFQQGGDYWVQGEHLPEAAKLQDVLQLQNETRFTLLGRSGDMINVGGKRASLANLNQLLLAVDGVKDGVIYMPDKNSKEGSARPAAFVVTALSEQDILKALSISIDPVFLPRPLIKIDKINRSETGKISREQLQKMEREFHA